MKNEKEYLNFLHSAYPEPNKGILLGKAKIHEQIITQLPIYVPVKNLNRHGLIAGATGGGKTKTVQLLAEGLSALGVNVLLMDMKGDISGLAQPNLPNEAIHKRQQELQLTYHPRGFPVELLSISEVPGVRLRDTVAGFGPILFSRLLDLNETQSAIIAVIFKYCSDQNLALVDLKDFRQVIHYAMQEGKSKIQERYGKLSQASLGTILRKIVELEEQHADLFFGEPSFNVQDLLKQAEDGGAYISILRLVDIQQQPKLFSTFMLSLLNEIYYQFPEVGDLSQPKLMIVIDEAHLLFSNAQKALIKKIEFIVRLIRSKGVGIVLCTQSPSDIPDTILSQLGFKIQHAMRAFTANERKAIKLIAQNYPENPHIDIETLLTKLGTGEALVSILDDAGRPTPTVDTFLQAPVSRMGPLTDAEIQTIIIAGSKLHHKYAASLDRVSAYEVLKKKMQTEVKDPDQKASSRHQANKKESKVLLDTLSKNTMVRQLGRTLLREVMRGIFKLLGIKK